MSKRVSLLNLIKFAAAGLIVGCGGGPSEEEAGSEADEARQREEQRETYRREREERDHDNEDIEQNRSALVQRSFVDDPKILWSTDYTYTTPCPPSTGYPWQLCVRRTEKRQRLGLNTLTETLYTTNYASIDSHQTWGFEAVAVSDRFILSRTPNLRTSNAFSFFFGYTGYLKQLDASGNIVGSITIGTHRSHYPTGISKMTSGAGDRYLVFWSPASTATTVLISVHNAAGALLSWETYTRNGSYQLRSVIKDDSGYYHVLWGTDAGAAELWRTNSCNNQAHGVCVDWLFTSWNRTENYQLSGFTPRNLTLQPTFDASGNAHRYPRIVWGEHNGNHLEAWLLDDYGRRCGVNAHPAGCPPYWRTPRTYSRLGTGRAIGMVVR